MTTNKIECRTPTPGKKPTSIDAAKFEAFRKAILRVVPKREPGVEFSDLPDLVAPHLPEGIGSLTWYTTTVKLELEVRGEIFRIPRSSPQRLIRK